MEKNENGYYVNENANGNENLNEINFRNSNSPRQLAMVYSPYQCWRMLYNEDDALKHGTLFEELYKPLEDGCV